VVVVVVLFSPPVLSTASFKPPDADEATEAGGHREPSGKGRKQDKKDTVGSGEGGKEKKEKKKAAASGAARPKNKQSPQNAPATAEPVDGSVACSPPTV